MRSHLPWMIVYPLMMFGIGACGLSSADVPPRNIHIQQDFALQPGSEVGGYQVVGSLGDVSIELKGNPITAPFDGQVEPTETDCIAFTSPEIPAYLFRLCGVKDPRLGTVKVGQKIGRGEVLQFAAMRRQPDGTWAMVEPAMDILERTVSKR